MEKWDLYDENRKRIHKKYIKGEKWCFGNYHIVVGVWVVNSQNKLLITKRSSQKDKYPELWENTYGSLLANEGSKTGAVRELFEETGIKTNENRLIYCCTSKSSTSFVDMYMLKYDVLISELKMQEGETVAAKWVSFEQFEDMFALGEVSPLAIERYYLVKENLKRLNLISSFSRHKGMNVHSVFR